MSRAKEKVLSILATATVDLQNGDSKTTVYTVPTGKSAIITHVVIHSPDASLAGGSDFDIGSGGSATSWLQTNDLSSMTATTDYIVLTSTTKYTVETAANAFGILPITGATADATATMTVMGYEF